MVEDKVAQIAAQIPALNFVCCPFDSLNVIAEYAALPLCVYISPVKGELNVENRNLRNYPQARIAFLDRAASDASGLENAATAQNMLALAQQFVVAVQQSAQFEPVEQNIAYEIIYNRFDSNLTGIILAIPLRETVGTPACDF
jgi:hypothetical protein